MKILILLSILSFNFQAETFKIEGAFFDFKMKDGLLLNGCDKSCDALLNIKTKKIDSKLFRNNIKFAGSIGSDVCTTIYQARSALGVNKDKDGRAFCVFKDNSMVEINSLTQFLNSLQKE